MSSALTTLQSWRFKLWNPMSSALTTLQSWRFKLWNPMSTPPSGIGKGTGVSWSNWGLDRTIVSSCAKGVEGGPACPPLIHGDYNGHFPRRFQIRGSNDGVTWDMLISISGAGPTLNAWWSTPILGAYPYRIIRIYNTGADSTGYTYLTLGDVEFWGVLA
jgi:hypothetical protein